MIIIIIRHLCNIDTIFQLLHIARFPTLRVLKGHAILESASHSDQQSFQTTIIVQGILGEPRLTLQIQGRGSFDERYISQTSDT